MLELGAKSVSRIAVGGVILAGALALSCVSHPIRLDAAGGESFRYRGPKARVAYVWIDRNCNVLPEMADIDVEPAGRKPKGIVWVFDGRQPGEIVTITAAPAGDQERLPGEEGKTTRDLFMTSFQIPDKENLNSDHDAVYSGEPRPPKSFPKEDGKVRGLLWSYTVGVKKGTEKVCGDDPHVCIRGGGGGCLTMNIGG